MKGPSTEIHHEITRSIPPDHPAADDARLSARQATRPETGTSALLVRVSRWCRRSVHGLISSSAGVENEVDALEHSVGNVRPEPATPGVSTRPHASRCEPDGFKARQDRMPSSKGLTEARVARRA